MISDSIISILTATTMGLFVGVGALELFTPEREFVPTVVLADFTYNAETHVVRFETFTNATEPFSTLLEFEAIRDGADICQPKMQEFVLLGRQSWEAQIAQLLGKCQDDVINENGQLDFLPMDELGAEIIYRIWLTSRTEQFVGEVALDGAIDVPSR